MKKRIPSLSLLASAGLLAASGSTAQAAVSFQFNEAWENTTGSNINQGTSGSTFNATHYPEWTYSESSVDNSTARTRNADTYLRLARSGSNTLGLYVTSTSLGLGTPNFDASALLKLSVETTRASSSSNSTGSSNVGAFIGDLAILFHPGINLHRVHTMNADLTNNTALLGNTGLGFKAGEDDVAAQGYLPASGWTRLEMTLIEKNALNYTLAYTVTDLFGDSTPFVYNNTFDVLKTDVGDLDRAGVRFIGGADQGDAIFRNFELSAVPEPSSTALLGLGGLALILRRRK